MTYYQMIIEMSNNKSKKFCRRGWFYYYPPDFYICLSVCGITKDGVRKEYENIYCNNGEAFIPRKDDVEGDDWEEFSPKQKTNGLTFLEALRICKSDFNSIRRMPWTMGLWFKGLKIVAGSGELGFADDCSIVAHLTADDFLASDWEIIK